MINSEPIPTLTRFELLLLAIALQGLGDSFNGVRGFDRHVTDLAAKLGIGDGLAEQAREWREKARKLPPYSEERAAAWREAMKLAGPGAST